MSEPTTEKLARALEEAGAPAPMIERARAGYYDDFKSPLDTPQIQLLRDARAYLGLEVIVEGVLAGDFDGTPEEAEAWAQSPDGQATFAAFLKQSAAHANREQRRHPR